MNMKNATQFWGIIALVVVIGTIIACGDVEGGLTGGGGGGSGGLSTLRGNVTISPNGTVTVNTELTAAYSGTETVTFQWYQNNTAISGETSVKYTPTTAGSYTVTVSRAGFNSKTSEVVTVTAETLPDLTGNVTISPSENVTTGMKLTAAYSGSETVTYQWNKSGTAIANETLITYTPTEAGSYTVTVKAAGYNSKTSTAVMVTGATLPDLTGNVTISPSKNVTAGMKLTAAYSGSETVTYQWNKDNAAISGATSNEYTPTEEGSYTVTAKADGFKPMTSDAVEVAVAKTLSSISAVYNETSHPVYTTTPFASLKNGLTVTATYSDNSTASIAAAHYTLSETALTEGSNTITVSYTEGEVTETTTFTVNVQAPVEYAVSLSPVTFPAADYGYGTQNAQAVIVTNIGTKASGILAVAITGQDFTLANTTLNSLPAGDEGEGFFNVQPKTGLNAGDHTAAITVSNSGNGISETLTVSFTVNKANPNVSWPSGLTATYGQTLSAISLPGNGTSTPAGTFTWMEAGTTSVGAVGTQSHNMTFTPTDAVNYNPLTHGVSITVNKANPHVTWPTGLTAYVGQTLSAISLTAYTNAGGTAGAFSWTTPSTSVGVFGVQSHNMTFTPTDANYNTATQNVNITVGYRVSFNTNGGGSIADLMITTSGTAASRPANPTRNSYVFDYWYTDAGFTVPYYFATPVTGNITLYAKWVSQADITAMAAKNMVFVPGGSFQMGKNVGTATGADVTPLHMVTLSRFSISKYQVTQAQYQTVMGSNPSSGSGVGGNYPVYNVNWYDALVFCNKLSMAEGLTPAYSIVVNGTATTDPAVWGTVPDSSIARWNAATIVSGSTGYRLPTEAQWEYAAKGGDPTAAGWVGYTYSGSNTYNDVAWHNQNSGNATHEVGTKAANGLGIYDMSGNVYEWCWDGQALYTADAQTDPQGTSSGQNRIRRGGCFYTTYDDTSSVSRDNFRSYQRDALNGFRLVRPVQ